MVLPLHLGAPGRAAVSDGAHVTRDRIVYGSTPRACEPGPQRGAGANRSYRKYHTDGLRIKLAQAFELRWSCSTPSRTEHLSCEWFTVREHQHVKMVSGQARSAVAGLPGGTLEGAHWSGGWHPRLADWWCQSQQVCSSSQFPITCEKRHLDDCF